MDKITKTTCEGKISTLTGTITSRLHAPLTSPVNWPAPIKLEKVFDETLYEFNHFLLMLDVYGAAYVK